MTRRQPGTALVTGAARGIGRALAEALLLQGHRVVVADIDGDAAARTAAELGDRAEPATLDVRDADAMEAFVARLDTDQALRLLVNNAGIALSTAMRSACSPKSNGDG